ncbi:tetratricopeptide repeat protein [Sphingosinicella sp.]|uniref:tetratricopeptide repeat protein n=1 Tax=Sphingosinicella sp. TaxID=1917971 RepID=UPI0040383AE6
MATLGMSETERAATEAFRRDVVEPSMTNLVILDFWSARSSLSTQLGPVLEKVAADYADKGVRLVRIDADKDKFLAAQLRVQSIPTVYAMFQGQPVADLSTGRSESQLKGAIDQLLAQLPVQGEAQQLEAEIEPLIAMGEQVLGEGDAERAANIFKQIIDMAPENPEAVAGLVRALIAAGQAGEARATLDALPEAAAKDPAVARARSALAVAEIAPAGDDAELRARIAADPDDHQARYDLAGALMARGDRDGAADQLLESIARDREWNESAARQRLLQLLEATGLEDPWAAAQRRRLSAILFG